MDEARSIESEVLGIRRTIHSNPELAFHENGTAKLVCETLEGAGIQVKTHVGGTGVVGLIKGNRQGRVVALRADMDALPLMENSGVGFQSRTEGVMHACGHDAHVAMLLGAAMILANHRATLHGTVKFLFQPAEEAAERGGGAKPMIEAGVLHNPKVDYVFGLHIFSNYPSGTFALRGGAAMAASGTFKIRIVGRGGHGSSPHLAVDPVFVAAQVITALQSIRSRMIDPVEPFVISVCSVHSGTANNIIPDEAVLEGTVRTVDENTRRKVRTLVPRVAKSTCRAFGATCEVELEEAYPATINDHSVTKSVSRILKSIPQTKVVEVPPLLTAEDFSFFLREVPGTYYFLGTRNAELGCVYPNHSSRFKIDEGVLKFGAASLALLASEFTKPE